MNRLRIAFAGFRHGHIFSLLHLARERPDIEIVAACEEDEKTRSELAASGKAAITHSSYHEMLDQVACDAVAVGDYYGKRGAILIEALQRGKHVISDKPICTSLTELDEIEKLAGQKNRVVGCQLDMRNAPTTLETRRLIQSGTIGDVHAIFVGGQHPLMYGKRPGWYFEADKHGGTINDIAIHAIDAIPWITGMKFAEVTAARAWNARLPESPDFQDAAQFMAKLSNGCGMLCDVSYLAPDACGYSIPQYWRMTFWGSKGMLESTLTANQIALYRNTAKSAEVIVAKEGQSGGYLESFLREIRGEKSDLHLSSADVLAASRTTLRIQEAADKNQRDVAL
jgi:predicted dehydrogenase